MAEQKAPAKTDKSEVAQGRSSRAEVDAFLKDVRHLKPAGSGRGRLIFAMDATMSRQPTWDMALKLQGDMFSAVKEVGGLDVQLVYFRGLGETRASKWVGDPEALARLMTRVSARALMTIGSALSCVGFYMLSRLTINDPSLTRYLPAQIIFGIGLGLILVPVTTADIRDRG